MLKLPLIELRPSLADQLRALADTGDPKSRASARLREHADSIDADGPPSPASGPRSERNAKDVPR